MMPETACREADSDFYFIDRAEAERIGRHGDGNGQESDTDQIQIRPDS
jgi:hypothetical protein